MLVKFWGVRGSIPCAGADTLVYGGSTSCVELRCGERTVVLDAGSGLRGFGQQLLLEGRPIDLDLLISHCHVDHLIGLPFFQPAFRPDAKIRLWTGHLQPSYCLEDAIAQLMMPPLFPITPETFKADTEYRDFRAGDRLDLGHSIAVSTTALNHPGGATGYRIDFGGRSVAYVTDHEHRFEEPETELVSLARGVDLLIVDATFTPDEYRTRHGWGHSTWCEAIKLAAAAQSTKLALFHHDPSHDDDTMSRIEAEARQRWPSTFVAREGLIMTL